MKQKLKSYNFWISLTSVLVLFARLIGEKFGFSISEDEFMDIMVVLCTVFAVLGIFEVPPSTSSIISMGENGTTMVTSSVAKVVETFKQIDEDISSTIKKIDESKGEEKMQNNNENIEKCVNNEEKPQIISQKIAKSGDPAVIKKAIQEYAKLGKDVKFITEIEGDEMAVFMQTYETEVAEKMTDETEKKQDVKEEIIAKTKPVEKIDACVAKPVEDVGGVSLEAKPTIENAPIFELENKMEADEFCEEDTIIEEATVITPCEIEAKDAIKLANEEEFCEEKTTQNLMEPCCEDESLFFETDCGINETDEEPLKDFVNVSNDAISDAENVAITAEKEAETGVDYMPNPNKPANETSSGAIVEDISALKGGVAVEVEIKPEV